MPLNPQVKALLDQEAGHPAKGIPVPRTPPDVANVADLTVPGPESPLRLRSYTPHGAGPFPVVLWLHGGGWVQGTIEANDATCRFLTDASRAIVLAVDYRLAPQTRFPGPLEDCYAALAWAGANATSIGGDPSRLAVAGASAGGNLAAAAALMARDRGGPRLAHQTLVYPITDLAMGTESYRLFATGHRLTADSMASYIAQYIGSEADKRNPYAAPILASDLSGLPPAHIITAEYDVLRDEGEAYGKRLAEAGIRTRVSRYPGMIHTFFNAMVGFDKTYEAIAEAGAELRRSLRAD
jgi:acetyl esterase